MDRYDPSNFDDAFRRRFFAKIIPTDQPDACWEWGASKNPKGYGQIGLNHFPLKAHKVAMVLAGTIIPSGWHVHHRCENHGCVRPDHLELKATMKAHAQEHLTGCWKHGEQDQRVIRSGKNIGVRYCAVCNREKAARYAAKKAGARGE